MAGRQASNTLTRYAGIQVQTSSLGLQIPVGWGTFRAGCNLADYLDFTSTAQKAATGKGGATTTGYNYSATIILAICEGPIDAITQVWVDGKVFANGSNGSSVVNTGSSSATTQVGLSMSLGNIGQAPWSYLLSAHPSHAIGYSGLALAFAENYALDSSASTPNHSFEVVRVASFAVGGGYTGPDIDPSLMVADFFQNTRTGVPSWGTGLLDPVSLAQYQAYCLASGLLLSPVIDQERSASDFLTEVLLATNSTVVWSEGLLKFIPYGDTAMTGNGQTFTPNLTPLYLLNDDSFVVDDEDPAPPLTADIEDQSDAYNVVQLEYLDRTNQYNMAIALASDAANVAQFQARRQDPTTIHCVCTPAVAAIAAQLYLQRTLYIRGQYKFKLPWSYALLEPGDIVELTDPGMGLSAYGVRIIQIDEDEKTKCLDVTCEDLLVGVSNSPLYTMQNGMAAQPNYGVDPGGVEANLLTWSTDWTNAAWTKTAMTVTAAAAADPVIGASDAQSIVPTAANTAHNVSMAGLAIFSGANYTYSAYLKADGYNFAVLRVSSGSDSAEACFALGAGVVNSTIVSGGGSVSSSSITSLGSGWYRCAFTFQMADTTINVALRPGDTAADAISGTFLGNGTSGVFAYGAQITQGVDVRPYALTTSAISGPQIFSPPSALTQSQGGRETWAAVAGGAFWGGANVWVSLDGGSNYELIGSAAQGPARFGSLLATYPSGSDPDTTHTVNADLSASNGALTSAADAVADQSGTLCLIDGTELISFSTATLIHPNRYNLTTYVRRGCLGTPISAHAAGATFVRLDSAIFDFPFLSTQAGQTVYAKFQSFNLWGQAETPLQDCVAYPFVPSAYGATTPGSGVWTATGGTLSNGGQSVPVIVITGSSDNASAQFVAFYYKPHGAASWLNGGTGPNSTTLHDITSVSPTTAYDVGVGYIVGGVAGAIQTIATNITVGGVNAGGGSAAPGTVLFDSQTAGSTGTITLPAGTYAHADFEVWGGDGGNFMQFFGPGDITPLFRGGSGSYSIDAGVSVTPGTTTFSGSIGAGGANGGYPGSSAGGNGSNSTIASPAITTHGGSGATGSAAGAGGTVGTGGTTNTAGTTGGTSFGGPGNGRIRITART